MGCKIRDQMTCLVALAVAAPDKDDPDGGFAGHGNLFKEGRILRVFFFAVRVMALQDYAVMKLLRRVWGNFMRRRAQLCGRCVEHFCGRVIDCYDDV